MLAFELLGTTPPEDCPSVVVVFGENAYLKGESLRVIVEAALGGPDVEGTAVTRFTGNQATLGTVLDEVRTYAFLAPKRVVIVDDADPFVSSYRKELESYVAKPATTGVLVLVVRSWPSNTKLAKLVSKTGLPVDCKLPSESDLTAWLPKLAKSRWKLKLGREASRLMVDLVGPEPGLLAMEVDKLAAFVGDRKEIAREDVGQMVSAGRTLAVWEMIDRATIGDLTGSLAILDQLMSSGEAPQGLLAAMSRSLTKVAHAGRLRLSKIPLADACRLAGVFYRDQEKVGKQHTHLGPSRTQELSALLLRADLGLKGDSTLDPRGVMERLLIQLARPRDDQPQPRAEKPVR